MFAMFHQRNLQYTELYWPPSTNFSHLLCITHHRQGNMTHFQLHEGGILESGWYYRYISYKNHRMIFRSTLAPSKYIPYVCIDTLKESSKAVSL